MHDYAPVLIGRPTGQVLHPLTVEAVMIPFRVGQKLLQPLRRRSRDCVSNPLTGLTRNVREQSDDIPTKCPYALLSPEQAKVPL